MRRLHADLTSSSLISYFDTLQQVMHSGSHGGTLGIITTGEFPGLISDEHRCAFVNSVDMPKGEWGMPLKSTNNKAFWGITDPILSNVSIPEDVRLMGAISLYRDVSKYRLPLVWAPFFWKPAAFDTTNHTAIIVNNNNKLRTFVGMGYVAGVENSISVRGAFFDILGDTVSYLEDDLWSLNPALTINSQLLPIATQTQITNIMKLSNKWSDLLRDKRPYRWASIYYSEQKRNDALYDIGASMGNSNKIANAWRNQLLPMYYAYQKLANGTVFPNRNIKLPVGFTFDDHCVAATTKLLIYSNCRENTSADSFYHITDALSKNIQRAIIPCYGYNDQSKYFTKLDSSFNNTPHSSFYTNLDTLIIKRLATNPPPFWIEGSCPNADKIWASFYQGDLTIPYEPQAGISLVTVPMVVDPIWSLPRRQWRTYRIKRFHADSIMINNNPRLVYKLILSTDTVVYKDIRVTRLGDNYTVFVLTP
jgi:hypothetical protein